MFFADTCKPRNITDTLTIKVANGNCTTASLELTVCAGHCAMSKSIPLLLSNNINLSTGDVNYLDETCNCCIGKANETKSVTTHCKYDNGTQPQFVTFYLPIITDCQCQSCAE